MRGKMRPIGLDRKSKDYLDTALLHKPICKGFFSDIIFK